MKSYLAIYWCAIGLAVILVVLGLRQVRKGGVMAAAEGKAECLRKLRRKMRTRRVVRLIDKDQEAVEAALKMRGKHLHRNPVRRKVEA